jgi:hypothetical protein
MADRTGDPDPAGDARHGHAEVPDRGSTAPYPGTPRWVKLSIGLVLLIVVVLVVLTALGLHTSGGPGGHGL